jgi:ubiquinone/menaquinone biosynthesis C-methylase UbiE
METVMAIALRRILVLIVTFVVLPVSIPARTGHAQTRTSSHEGNRESWQRVPDVFAAMGVVAGSVVADVGAGDGFFTTRLAKAVGPTGRVYAVDISASVLERLKANAAGEQLTNVEAVLGAPNDPRLPAATLDAALIVNAYHEMREHQSMLLAIRRALKPSGRLVIVEGVIDGQRGVPRSSQENRHFLAPQYLQQDAIAAGFVIARVEDPFTRRMGTTAEYLVTLVPAPEPTAALDPGPAHSAAENTWKKPDEVVAALRLQPGQVVVDLGAGSGDFTRRFAKAVGPSGRAIGLDIDPAAVARMQQDATTLNLANYEARLVAPADPGLAPASADVIFLSNTYHHIEDRIAYFSRLRSALKPGGRLVIVDFTTTGGGAGMPGHADAAQTEGELGRAGFRLARTHGFLERQFFLEFVVRPALN